MNKKFTKLIAAVALLTLLIPMKGWGQTRDNWSYTFSAKVWSAAGAQTINEVSWTMAGTGGSYFGYDGTKGQQFGSSSAPYSAVSLSTTGISGTITEVAVNTSGASSINATVAVSVDGTAFTCSGNTTASLTSTATTYTFTGSDNGEIVISWAQTSSKAIYVKSISVTYSVGQTYTVTYDANGGTIGTVPTDGSAYANGATVTVKNRNTLEHATLGFKGWNTAADGSGTFYDPGDTFTMGSSDVTLYAVWTAKCTFAYNGNGNTGGAVPTGYYTSYGTGAKVTVVDNTGSLVKTGAAWEAWNTVADGSGTTYNPDDVFTITTNTTLYAKWRDLATYTLVTSTDDLEAGKHYIIASGKSGTVYVMGAQSTNNRPGVSGNTVTSSSITEKEGIYEFVLNSDSTGYWTIYDEVNKGFLYAASSSNNQLKTQSTNNKNGVWTITFSNDDAAVITAQGSNTRKIIRFNSSLFSCYASGQDPIYLYKKDGESTSTFVKNIGGYGSNSNTGGWYLIASPVTENITPTADNGFLTSAYDLYYFDQSETNGKWRNFKKDPAEGGHWDIESGKGYLYASQTVTTLIFTGTPNSTGVVALTYPADPTGLQFPGLNLIGNPFATAATLNKAFYRMNGDGDGFVSALENTSVSAMEGVFVQATGTGQSATFTVPGGAKAGEPKSIPSLNVIVCRERGSVIDNAIFRFDDGETLGKFMLDESGTKLCVPMNGKEFAIVNAQAEGEMPVNFKAAENGSYTLSFSIENAEMDYLHLIDNMTGADVDLLQTPSYTFDARTSDYASRFRLVFSANDENGASTGSATFAYFNGSEWVVNSNGNATLQVVDVMGRVLSSETVNGNHTMNLNLSTGIYMLRLVNGNDVKTQKIVVR